MGSGHGSPFEKSRIIPGHYQPLAPALPPAGSLGLGDATGNQPALPKPSLGETGMAQTKGAREWLPGGGSGDPKVLSSHWGF